MNGSYFPLAHDLARRRAIDAVRTAPVGYIVRISESKRSLEQNALVHALLSEVGDLINWTFDGVKVDVDDLKSIFMAAYRKATGAEVRLVAGIDGQPVILNWRTHDLTKQECSEFIEMVRAWMIDKRRTV